jgi:eukaryotic-like serine/threonine-protein kinase
VADAALKQAGLHVRLGAPVHSIPYAKGDIARESPGPGARISHGGTVTLHLSLGPAQHQLPSVEGESTSAATATLSNLHIGVSQVDKIYNTDVQKGSVIKTDPASGETVFEGSKVTLYVSKGPAPVSIPTVVGETEADATAQLKALQLFVNPMSKYSNTVAQGVVISSNPTAGTQTHAGKIVSLVVSKGPHLYPVPNVVGENITQAEQDITAAGFTPNPMQIFAAPGGTGRVDRETPSGMQAKGTTIDLYYF